MERKIFSFVTFVIVAVGIPYLIYNVYIKHEDSLYKSLKEYTGYTTVDKKYDIKLMCYSGLTGGEEMNRFKIYIVDNKTQTAYFIKNENVSSYGTDIDFSEEKTFIRYEVNIFLRSATKDSMLTLDMKELCIKGQKVRALF